MKQDDYIFLEKVIQYASKTGSYNALNLIENTNNFCLWGCGKYFLEAYEKQFSSRGYSAKYVVDRDPKKHGKIFFDGVECISPKQLFNLKDPVVVPLLSNGYYEVVDLLKKNHIVWIELGQYFFDMQDNGERSREWFVENSSKILKVYQLLEDEESKKIYANIICNRIANVYSCYKYYELYSDGQYFSPNNIYTVHKNENFVDIGAFDGDSIEDFVSRVGSSFEAIHAFELSKKTYNKLMSRLKGYPTDIEEKITCYNLGAWDVEVELKCGEEKTHTGEGCSINKGKSDFLDEDEIEITKCVPVDKVLENDHITLLKMDVEGAEQHALRGCEKIIKANKPKLAICIYHNVDDLWEIPLEIKRMVPEYKLFVRHHTTGFGDTVCYAVCN